jgi:hypothetical protein
MSRVPSRACLTLRVKSRAVTMITLLVRIQLAIRWNAVTISDGVGRPVKFAGVRQDEITKLENLIFNHHTRFVS